MKSYTFLVDLIRECPLITEFSYYVAVVLLLNDIERPDDVWML
jgi:hypothetical protein